MNLEKLEKILSEEKPYRVKQAKKAVYQDLIENWDQATNLSKDLRIRLNSECPLAISAEEVNSRDLRTSKAVLGLVDGKKIEAVLMRHKDSRNTVCVSCQVGCAMGCLFCATGMMGFERNLTVSEILEQVLYFGRLLKKEDAQVTNVVYMGMGEPFLNYNNVIKSIRIFNDQEAFGVGARKIAVSTCGIVPGIEKFMNENWQVNLAVSLHAPNDEVRSRIMPISKARSIEKILKAVDKYIAKTSRRVMFEYLMIKGVNDSEKQAQELAKLMKKPLYLVNLIKYNQTGKFRPSDDQAISKFVNILLRAGIPTTQRYSYGHEISAACGQLASRKK